MHATDRARPDWDMTAYFSAPNGPDYRAFRAALTRDITDLRARTQALAPPAADNRAAWVELLLQIEDLGGRLGHISSYLSCLGSADAADEAIQREAARLAPLRAEREKIHVAVRAAFKAADGGALDALFDHDALRSARYVLDRIRVRADQTMPPALEDLAADLSVDGISAWGRLYDQVSGTLTFEHAPPGRPTETLPISMTRTLLEDADPEVRRAAARGAATAWERTAAPVAAALNAIAGTRLVLYGRRGIDHFLAPALFDAAIERGTLDAMLDAVRARQELGRRYLRAKARRLGLPELGFCDLLAPLPSAHGERRLSWREGTERVLEAFGGSYPALRAFAAHALDQRWIDYQPRPGKRPGAFCSSSHVIKQSRVFMTYNGAGGDVQTLAHELGHAFHNWLMRDMRTWTRGYPMTLAETASTFAEQLVTDAALERADTGPAERIAILDQRLMAAATFLLNIPMRFDFEHALYERRAGGELTVSELKQLMLDAQRANYGDALAADQLDPWFWASKLHFYITGLSFYNFPYTFGYLFSLGIFARAKRQGASFLPTYERLLRATGSASAEHVAREVLGAELGEAGFWNASIDLIEADLRAYEQV
jgi:oligoendopeptidase F